MTRARGYFLLKILIVLAVLLTGGSVFSFYSLLYEENNRLEPTVLLVERGDSFNTIARRLKKEELIDSASIFKIAARLSGQDTSIKAGEYRIPPKASAKMILDILVKGDTIVRNVTIPEGKTSAQVFEILRQTKGLEGDLPEVPENAMLLPETYRFTYGTPRRIIVQRMLDAAAKTIEELWEFRDPDLPYTTKNEALTLASIVEKETAVASERSRIAGVFVNRLRQGMRLQSDPTVIYAVTGGTMELNRPLTFKDLKQEHPHNTYTSYGIPPSPIVNPGRDAILAVLRPMQTEEIYFVADGTGGHAFSKTFDQHKKNIASWKKFRRQAKLNQAKSSKAAKPAAPKEAEMDTAVLEIEGDTTIVEDVIAAEKPKKQVQRAVPKKTPPKK